MKYTAKNCAKPLINDLAATKPWQALSKYLIILDRFSHLIVVKSSDRIVSATTIRLLLEVFSEHGLPQKIRCHRGTNFTSLDFTNFCSDYPLVAHTIISLYLQNAVCALSKTS